MNIEIANRLYEYRKKNNLSQEELAEKIGVSRQAVSKWERTEASPDTDNLILLAKIYGVSLDDLLKTEEPVITEPPAVESPLPLAEGTHSDEKTTKTDNRTFLDFFPYPLVCVIVFMLLGFLYAAWHIAWVVFLTIPLYYGIADAYRHRNKNR